MINEKEGNITVRFQGRTLDRRPREVRPHVPHLIYALGLFEHKGHASLQLGRFVENMERDSLTTSGMVFSHGWHLSPFIASREGQQLLQAALLVAILGCT